MNARIVWLTGLSGSGKSSISISLAKSLSKKFKVYRVDGDDFRKKNKISGRFTKQSIIKNNLNILEFLKKIEKKYDFVIVSVISPILKTRNLCRIFFGERYFEIYVHCKISTLKKRDTKGLYKLADQNRLKNLIGYKSKIKYEKSKYKKISINTDISSLAVARKIILNKIIQKNETK